MIQIAKAAIASFLGVFVLASLLFAESDPNILFLEASALLNSAQETERESYSAAYPLYEASIQKLEALFSEFPDSSLVAEISKGKILVGPYKLDQLRELILPQAKKRADAEENPLEVALLIAEKKADPAYRGYAIRGVALRYAEERKDERALEVALTKTWRGQRPGLLLDLSENYAKRGLIEKASGLLALALESAEAIPGTQDTLEIRASQLAAVANAYVKAGKKEKGLAIIARANEDALQIEHAYYRGRALSSVAEGYLKIGEDERASKLFSDVIQIMKNGNFEFGYPSKALVIAESYARAGMYDKAIEIIHNQPPSNRGKEWDLLDVGKIAALRGDRARADEIFRMALQVTGDSLSLQMNEQTAKILVGLASVSTKIGEEKIALDLLSQAAETMAQIKGDHDEARFFAEMALGYSEAGEREKASHLLSKALDSIDRTPGGSKDYVLGKIASGYIKIGRYHDALQIIRLKDSPYGRASILLEVAAALGGDSQREGAMELLSQAAKETDAMDSMDLRLYWLLQIANAYAELGEKQKASNLLAYAVDLSHTSEHSSSRSFHRLADGYIKIGILEKASQILSKALHATETMRDQYERNNSLTDIAIRFVQIDQVTRAMEVADLIKDDGKKAEAFSKMAATLEHAGNETKATELAAAALAIAENPNLPIDPWHLPNIAEALGEAGHLKGAERIAEKVQDPNKKIPLLLELSRIYMGRDKKAEGVELLPKVLAMAQTLNDGSSRAIWLGEIAQIWAKEGERKKALQMLTQAREASLQPPPGTDGNFLTRIFAKVLPRSKLHHDLLTSVVEGYVTINKSDLAIETASLIGKPYEKSRALLRVAKHLAETGRETQALSLLAQAHRLAHEVKSAWYSEKSPLLADIAGVYFQVNERTKGREILSEAILETKALSYPGPFISVAFAAAGGGEQEKALDLLIQALHVPNNSNVDWVKAIQLGEMAFAASDASRGTSQLKNKTRTLLHEIIKEAEALEDDR
ncbi:tetratricopeptide repeat protein [Candidatus Manganitrophus noduliformans]|uniref:Tetratricopeptide repeat protein n=1 Tax=Candidatus Manganitrophus noduliformans TaxID=2606439 RepID=A0A7X6DLG3_9BACT|nr:hypothetical protein [Candidatus Manganitrophus noduliformans]NKE69138.1 hypothetical protein [Candidatus Manganitrophus noduliformans]